jgi:hypothetical protein
MNLFDGLLLPLAILLPILFFVVVVKLVLTKVGHNKRLPFDISTNRRIPGQSVLSEFNDSTADLFGHMSMLVLLFNIPFIQVGVYQLLGVEQQSSWLIIPIFAFGIIYVVFKLVRTVTSRNNLRLGLEAEWAVSSELHDIEVPNYKIFHDIQCDKFNIDHLVVGPNGVFAIETKGRRKPSNSKTAEAKSKEHVVTVNGNVLEFPNYKDTSIVEQAIRQAKWATNWLSDATGERVTVSPVVTIPGWYVKRTSQHDVPVLASKVLNTQVPKLPGQRLSPEQITRIAHQIKQKALRTDNVI